MPHKATSNLQRSSSPLNPPSPVGRVPPCCLCLREFRKRGRSQAEEPGPELRSCPQSLQDLPTGRGNTNVAPLLQWVGQSIPRADQGHGPQNQEHVWLCSKSPSVGEHSLPCLRTQVNHRQGEASKDLVKVPPLSNEISSLSSGSKAGVGCIYLVSSKTSEVQ